MGFLVTILFLWLTLFLQCGAPTKSRKFHWLDRIAGSKVLSITDFPYIVSIQNYEGPLDALVHSCAGVIISEDWVLTAANCLNKKPEKVKVFKGGNVGLHKGLYYQVDKIIVHPNFKPTKDERPPYNIAVLHLKKSLFSHNSNASAIALGRIPDESGIQVETVGWSSSAGDLGIFDVFRDHFETGLRKLSLQTMDSGHCGEIHNKSVDKEICIFEGLGNWWCSIDAGHPLITMDTRRLVGIGGAFRYTCNNKNWPGLFTRLSVYIDWLREVTELKLPLD